MKFEDKGIILNSKAVWKASVSVISTNKAEDIRPGYADTILCGTLHGFLPAKYIDNEVARKLWAAASGPSEVVITSEEEHKVLKQIATDVYALYGESIASKSWWSNALRLLEQSMADGHQADMQSFMDSISVFECRFECVGTMENMRFFIKGQLAM